MVLQVRAVDPIGPALEVAHTAGTADFGVALAVERDAEWLLLRDRALPWVPVHRRGTGRPELALEIGSPKAERSKAIAAADRRSIATIAVTPDVPVSAVIELTAELRAAGIDDWRLHRR